MLSTKETVRLFDFIGPCSRKLVCIFEFSTVLMIAMVGVTYIPGLASDQSDFRDYSTLDRADEHKQQRDAAEIIGDCTNKLNKDPKDSYILYKRGLAYEELARSGWFTPFNERDPSKEGWEPKCAEYQAKAIADYIASIASEKNHSEPYLQLRLLYSETGQHDKAAKAVTDCLSAVKIPKLGSYPNKLDLVELRASCYEDCRQYQNALVDYDWLVASYPDHNSLRGSRAHCYIKCGQYQNAVADCNWLIASHPNNEDLYYFRAQVYMDCGQYQNALPDYNLVIKKYPNDDGYYRDRALCYEKLGMQDRASQDYRTAESFPKSKGGGHCLGHFHWRTIRFE